MDKILNLEELNKLEEKIYKTGSVNIFSPQDIINLIKTGQVYYRLTKDFNSLIEPVKVSKETARFLTLNKSFDIMKEFVENGDNMNSPLSDMMSHTIVKILKNGWTIEEDK